MTSQFPGQFSHLRAQSFSPRGLGQPGRQPARPRISPFLSRESVVLHAHVFYISGSLFFRSPLTHSSQRTDCSGRARGRWPRGGARGLHGLLLGLHEVRKGSVASARQGCFGLGRGQPVGRPSAARALFSPSASRRGQLTTCLTGRPIWPTVSTVSSFPGLGDGPQTRIRTWTVIRLHDSSMSMQGAQPKTGHASCPSVCEETLPDLRGP